MDNQVVKYKSPYNWLIALAIDLVLLYDIGGTEVASVVGI